MTHNPLILAAKNFARQNHDDRKFAHCDAVASILAIISVKPELVAAAYLHDALWGIERDYAQEQFGKVPTKIVEELCHALMAPNDRSYIVRLTEMSPDAQTVKLALIFNLCIDNAKNDDTLGKYLGEKELEINALHEGNKFLWETVHDYVQLQMRKTRSVA